MALADVYSTLENVSAYSVYVPVLVCILRIKALNKTLWAFFIYLLLCIISDRASLKVVENEKLSNILFNSFAIVEYGFISFIYYCEFESKRARSAVIACLALFSVFSLLIFVFKGKFNQSDTIISPLEAIVITGFAGTTLVRLLLDRSTTKLTKHYFYWINLAFLLYFATAILLFLNNDFMNRCEPGTAYVIWGLHLVLNSITNILSAIGVWMKRITK